jgi:hypothetical protein
MFMILVVYNTSNTQVLYYVCIAGAPSRPTIPHEVRHFTWCLFSQLHLQCRKGRRQTADMLCLIRTTGGGQHGCELWGQGGPWDVGISMITPVGEWAMFVALGKLPGFSMGLFPHPDTGMTLISSLLCV